jgi:hypothetical protein
MSLTFTAFTNISGQISDIATSTNGQYILVSTSDISGNFFTTNNGGFTWTQRQTGFGLINACDVSRTGRYQYIVGSSKAHYSLDFGQTWSTVDMPSPTPILTPDVSISTNEQYVVIGSSAKIFRIDLSNPTTVTTANFIGQAPSENVLLISVVARETVVLAVADPEPMGGTRYIYRSLDSGATFSQLSSFLLEQRVAAITMDIAANRVIICGVVQGDPNGGFIRLSTDGGTTFGSNLVPSPFPWDSCSMSYDGQTIIVAGRELLGVPVASVDSGSTWTSVSASSSIWKSVAVSGDGTLSYILDNPEPTVGNVWYTGDGPQPPVPPTPPPFPIVSVVSPFQPRNYIPSPSELTDARKICRCPCECTAPCRFLSYESKTRLTRAFLAGQCCGRYTLLDISGQIDVSGSGIYQLKRGRPTDKPLLIKWEAGIPSVLYKASYKVLPTEPYSWVRLAGDTFEFTLDLTWGYDCNTARLYQ